MPPATAFFLRFCLICATVQTLALSARQLDLNVAARGLAYLAFYPRTRLLQFLHELLLFRLVSLLARANRRCRSLPAPHADQSFAGVEEGFVVLDDATILETPCRVGTRREATTVHNVHAESRPTIERVYKVFDIFCSLFTSLRLLLTIAFLVTIAA